MPVANLNWFANGRQFTNVGISTEYRAQNISPIRWVDPYASPQFALLGLCIHFFLLLLLLLLLLDIMKNARVEHTEGANGRFICTRATRWRDHEADIENNVYIENRARSMKEKEWAHMGERERWHRWKGERFVYTVYKAGSRVLCSREKKKRKMKITFVWKCIHCNQTPCVPLAYYYV